LGVSYKQAAGATSVQSRSGPTLVAITPRSRMARRPRASPRLFRCPAQICKRKCGLISASGFYEWHHQEEAQEGAYRALARLSSMSSAWLFRQREINPQPGRNRQDPFYANIVYRPAILMLRLRDIPAPFLTPNDNYLNARWAFLAGGNLSHY
jgi:hypothetical protein